MDLFNNDGQATTVTGVELADWLGVTPAAVSKAKTDGRVKTGPDGRFELKASVRMLYQAAIRRREHGELHGNQDRQLKYWQVENLKAKNAAWRRKYGERLILAYIQHHQESLNAFRSAVEGNPAAVRAGLELAESARRTVVGDVIDGVAGEDDAQELDADVAE
jgi:hypothetical protein